MVCPKPRLKGLQKSSPFHPRSLVAGALSAGLWNLFSLGGGAIVGLLSSLAVEWPFALGIGGGAALMATPFVVDWRRRRQETGPAAADAAPSARQSVGLPHHAARRRIRRRIDLGAEICDCTSPYDPFWVSHYPPEQRDAVWEEGLRANIPYRQAIIDWHTKNVMELQDVGFGAIHLYPTEEAVPDDYRWYRTWVERRVEELEQIERLL